MLIHHANSACVSEISCTQSRPMSVWRILIHDVKKCVDLRPGYCGFWKNLLDVDTTARESQLVWPPLLAQCPLIVLYCSS